MNQNGISYQVTWLDVKSSTRKSIRVGTMRAVRDIITSLETVRPGDAVDISFAYTERGPLNTPFLVWFERDI